MSILNKLKAAKDAKELKLHDVHPLAQESHDSRLRYLSAVAWALGLDREPLPIEQEAFVALAGSLSVDAGDAQELLAERANVTEEDMASMLEMAKSQKFVYLLDVCWMLVMDGKVEAAEREFLEGIAPMVEVKPDFAASILRFSQILRSRASAEYLTQDGICSFFAHSGLLTGNSVVEACSEVIRANTSNVMFESDLGGGFFGVRFGDLFVYRISDIRVKLGDVIASGSVLFHVKKLVEAATPVQTVDELDIKSHLAGIVSEIVVTKGKSIKHGDVVLKVVAFQPR